MAAEQGGRVLWIDGGDTKLPQGGASFYRCILFKEPRSGFRIGRRDGKLSRSQREIKLPLVVKLFSFGWSPLVPKGKQQVGRPLS